MIRSARLFALVLGFLVLAILSPLFESSSSAQNNRPAAPSPSQNGAWRSVLTANELAQVSAQLPEKKATLDNKLLAAQSSNSPTTMSRFVKHNAEDIIRFSGLIDSDFEIVKSTKRDAEAGRSTGVLTRNRFISYVAQREALLYIHGRALTANARIAKVAADQRQAALSQQRQTAIAGAQPPRERIMSDLIPKTPADYMKNDGVMDRAEMSAEAEDMRKLCDQNASLKVIMHCDCYANAFLRQRIKNGPNLSQGAIGERIVNTAEVTPACFKVEQVVESVTGGCSLLAKGNPRVKAADIPKYCSCVKAKVTQDFQAAPRVSSSYRSEIGRNAYQTCAAP